MEQRCGVGKMKVSVKMLKQGSSFEIQVDPSTKVKFNDVYHGIYISWQTSFVEEVLDPDFFEDALDGLFTLRQASYPSRGFSFYFLVTHAAKTKVQDKALESDESYALEIPFSEACPLEDSTSEVQKATEEQPLTLYLDEGNTQTSVRGEFFAKEKPQLGDTNELLTAQLKDTADFPQVLKCQSFDLETMHRIIDQNDDAEYLLGLGLCTERELRRTPRLFCLVPVGDGCLH